MRVTSSSYYWLAGRWWLFMIAVVMALGLILERQGQDASWVIVPAWMLNLFVAWNLGRAVAENGIRR